MSVSVSMEIFAECHESRLSVEIYKTTHLKNIVSLYMNASLFEFLALYIAVRQSFHLGQHCLKHKTSVLLCTNAGNPKGLAYT